MQHEKNRVNEWNFQHYNCKNAAKGFLLWMTRDFKMKFIYQWETTQNEIIREATAKWLYIIFVL